MRASNRVAYSCFARIYDRVMGDAVFPLILRSFKIIIARHGLFHRSIADIGCGTGTFLRQIWRPGMVAFGVDRSTAMLKIAARKNADNGVVFLQQDIRDVKLPQRVKLVTCNHDTLNYLPSPREFEMAMHSCCRNLHPQGHFIFDMIGPADKTAGAGASVQTIRSHGVHSIWYIWWFPRRKLSVVTMYYFQKNRELKPEWQKEVHRQRWYALPLVRQLLARTGFELLGAYDAGTMENANRSTFWVKYIAQKR